MTSADTGHSTTPAIAHDLDQHLDSMETRLASMQTQIQRLQRLASLGTMSAMLAHEINNILTPILSYAQYALQQNDTDLMRTALDKTLSNARRMAALCERVLGLASEDDKGPRDQALLPLVTGAVESLGRGLERDNIELTVDLPEDLTAHVHGGHLQQVLFNLVLNARQAMLGRRGRLTISGGSAESGRVTLTIADNGPGIRSDDLDRIFEPFFTTKHHHDRPDRRGIGLGLTICRQLIEDMGGSIVVESRPGRGATFTLDLPAA